MKRLSPFVAGVVLGNTVTACFAQQAYDIQIAQRNAANNGAILHFIPIPLTSGSMVDGIFWADAATKTPRLAKFGSKLVYDSLSQTLDVSNISTSDVSGITPFGASLVGAANNPACWTVLGLGTAAGQASSAFAAATHTHPISDVVNLQLSLDGKETAGAAATVQAFAIQRANHTGTQAISTVTGLQTALDGKETADAAATAQAFAIQRANHTGTQAISTVTGLQTALDSKLTTEVDGSTTNEIELPTQTSNSGKFLSTNGTTPFWSSSTLSFSAPTVVASVTNNTAFQPRSGGPCMVAVQAALSGLVGLNETITVSMSATQNGTYTTVTSDVMLISVLGLTLDRSLSSIPVPAGWWVKVVRSGSAATFGYTRWDVN